MQIHQGISPEGRTVCTGSLFVGGLLLQVEQMSVPLAQAGVEEDGKGAVC